MNIEDQRDREALRDRFLEIALEEVMAEPPVQEVGVSDERRPARWPPAVAAAGLLIIALVLFRGSPDELSPIEGGRVDGIVLTAAGEPVPGATIRLELGFTDHVFSPTRRGASAARRTSVTDEGGRFHLDGIPEGSVGMAFVAHGGTFGRVPAASGMEIVLEDGGRVLGTLVAAHPLIGELRVAWVGNGWPRTGRGPVEVEPSGGFELRDLPPGPGFLRVTRGRWTVAVVSTRVRSGEQAHVSEIRVEKQQVVSPDPLVDADRVRIIDGNGQPVPMAELSWTRPEWRGRLVTDRRGEGEFFGPPGEACEPPYLVALRMIPTRSGSCSGRWLEVVHRTAVIELTPTRTVVGMVNGAGGETVAEYALFYETAEETPRRYTGYVRDGRFLIRVPAGPGTMRVLTTDGRLHRTGIDVPVSREPLDLLIEVSSY